MFILAPLGGRVRIHLARSIWSTVFVKSTVSLLTICLSDLCCRKQGTEFPYYYYIVVSPFSSVNTYFRYFGAVMCDSPRSWEPGRGVPACAPSYGLIDLSRSHEPPSGWGLALATLSHILGAPGGEPTVLSLLQILKIPWTLARTFPAAGLEQTFQSMDPSGRHMGQCPRGRPANLSLAADLEMTLCLRSPLPSCSQGAVLNPQDLAGHTSIHAREHPCLHMSGDFCPW